LSPAAFAAGTVPSQRSGGTPAARALALVGGRDPGGKGAFQHPTGQSGFGGGGDVFGHPGGGAAVRIVNPAAGHVQLPVNDRVPVAAGVGQVDRDLGVVDLARRGFSQPLLRFTPGGTCSLTRARG
jgi:hypothetical protein